MTNPINRQHLSPAWLAEHQADCEEPRIELGEDFACKTCAHRATWRTLRGRMDTMCGKLAGIYQGLNVENIRECSGARKG